MYLSKNHIQKFFRKFQLPVLLKIYRHTVHGISTSFLAVFLFCYCPSEIQVHCNYYAIDNVKYLFFTYVFQLFFVRGKFSLRKMADAEDNYIFFLGAKRKAQCCQIGH